MTEKVESPLLGQEYRSTFTLYSRDGKRSADVLEFQNGETYLDEQEWVEGTTFKNRHSGRLVGPFASPADAEKFIVATPWFVGSRKFKGPLAVRLISRLVIAVLIVLVAGYVICWWLVGI